MARSFSAASSQYLSVGTAVVTAFPFAMACWFNMNDATTNYTLLFVGDKDVSDDWAGLIARGADTGDPIWAFQIGTDTWAISSTGYSASTWHHGIAIFVSATDRRVLLDGGSKGTDADSEGITAYDTTAIGAQRDSTPGGYADGSIAEAAFWDLSAYPGATDSDKADTFEAAVIPGLAAGYRPSLFPIGLTNYWPVIGRTSPEIDIVGGFDMTLTNGPTAAEHPPMIRRLPNQFFARAALNAARQAVPLVIRQQILMDMFDI